MSARQPAIAAKISEVEARSVEAGITITALLSRIARCWWAYPFVAL